MIIIYLFKLLVIYITNLYRRKISTFFLSKDKILVKKTPTTLHEKKTVCRQWTPILIFCVDVHMGLDSPVHMRPPEPDPSPLHVDVINGCPLIKNVATTNITDNISINRHLFIFSSL